MTASEHAEEVIFTAARRIADEVARAQYVQEMCGNDEALRHRVEALLAVDGGPDDLLDNPAVPTPGDTQTGTKAGPVADDRLDFLTPSDKPAALGRIGHYEVQEVIGRGGMGVVLKAFDEKLHRVVAVKVMAPQLATSATARQRFVREARAAAAVRDEHVVNIHAVEETDGLPYLVMEYISGISLQDRLDRSGPLRASEVLRIGMQTAAGLAAAHAQGLIHRDVKPANILLENGVERVKITDFGLARAVDDASLTQSGTIAGTPQYMAPEQARGEAVDHRSDLFSLGSVLYAMCAGQAPFRATGTMAVLKRVCEAEPRPLREVSPETPDWLIALIAKLQAKTPADRFQSAAEVAELLGKYLAHVQQPALVPLPSRTTPLPQSMNKEVPSRLKAHRRRWATAAVILLALVAGLGATEAAGVTRVRATLIRIFTPDGTLVVEVDDPDVKVTIEGDGGIVITGAGAQEVRLRPGIYKVTATKDGKQVRDEELVTISRGGKQVVKVSREADRVAAAPSDGLPLAAGEIRRFVGLTGTPTSVAFSPDGLLVFSGNGVGYKNGKFEKAPDYTARLWEVKTGRELRSFPQGEAAVTSLAMSPDGRRGLVGGTGSAVRVWDLETEQETVGYKGHSGVVYSVVTSRDGRYAVSGGEGSNNIHLWDVATGKRVHLFKWGSGQAPPPDQPDSVVWAVAISPDGNRVAAGGMSYEKQGTQLVPQYVIHTWDAIDGKVLHVFQGHSEQVKSLVFSPDSRRLLSGSFDGTVRLWDVETGKQLRIIGRHRGMVEAVALSPDGRRALSAGWEDKTVRLWDVEAGREILSIPHPRETWSVAFSPDGRRALSGSTDGIVRLWQLPDPPAALPTAQPFVLHTRTGAEVGTFDTLARAVVSANGGDIIEIRGNGPFVCEPINIRGTALTIRAGDGFRPVITFRLEGLQHEVPLLESDARLVVEGLEFQRVGQKRSPGDFHRTISLSGRGTAHIANCRFPMQDSEHIVADVPVCEIRNCEFVGGGQSVIYFLPTEGRLVLDNCVHVGAFVNIHNYSADPQKVAIRLTRNTMLADLPVKVSLNRLPKVPATGQAARPIDVAASLNVFEGRSGLFYLNQTRLLNPATVAKPEEAETFVERLFAWRGQRNLYPSGIHLFGCDAGANTLQPTRDFKSLAVWKMFWGSSEDGSLQGRPLFQGGDLRARGASAPELIKPDDFRLRPDSPGHKAGEGGRDLGADVDLVGPGRAYERWKKTPEYQQWLKDTGQVKK